MLIICLLFLFFFFSRFPTRDNVRNKWKNFILENNLNKKNINKNSVICSKHFDQTLFRTHKTRKFLLANAVPSKIILRVKSVSNLYCFIRNNTYPFIHWIVNIIFLLPLLNKINFRPKVRIPKKRCHLLVCLLM